MIPPSSRLRRTSDCATVLLRLPGDFHLLKGRPPPHLLPTARGFLLRQPPTWFLRPDASAGSQAVLCGLAQDAKLRARRIKGLRGPPMRPFLTDSLFILIGTDPRVLYARHSAHTPEFSLTCLRESHGLHKPLPNIPFHPTAVLRQNSSEALPPSSGCRAKAPHPTRRVPATSLRRVH